MPCKHEDLSSDLQDPQSSGVEQVCNLSLREIGVETGERHESFWVSPPLIVYTAKTS